MDSVTSPIAATLLAVLCFLNGLEIHEEIILLGMGLIRRLVDFPKNHAQYRAALKHLIALNKVSLEKKPTRFLRITDTLKWAVIRGLNMDERIAAFNAAVCLLSHSWPWLTTFNATDVDRLHVVQKYRSHITALRNVCMGLEPGGFVPGLGFCALLHEEAMLGIMQNTVADMVLDCAQYALPLAGRILNQHRGAETDPARKDKYERLRMHQARFVATISSMVGWKNEASEKIKDLLKLFTGRLLVLQLPEDKRTIAFVYMELGLCKLRLGDVSEAEDFFQLATESHGMKMGTGENAFKFLFPQVVYALFLATYHRSQKLAMSIVDGLMSERGQRKNLIFDDLTSLDTGIILFAKGKMTYFSTPTELRDAKIVEKALSFLRRAVDVLNYTHGAEALWTLAATYRMAVCLFDLGEYNEAIIHLDTINRALQDYKREFTGQDCSEILGFKGRALWKNARALSALDDEAHELEAVGMIDEALEIHWAICGTFVDEPSMTDAHWDSVVFFLYR